MSQRMLELRPTCHDGYRRSCIRFGIIIAEKGNIDPNGGAKTPTFLVGALRGPIAIMQPSHHHTTLR
jgi:hypothetical protein